MMNPPLQPDFLLHSCMSPAPALMQFARDLVGLVVTLRCEGCHY